MFEKNKVLVIGMGKSGLASAKYLLKNGARVVLCDSKNVDKNSGILIELKNLGDIEFILGKNPTSSELKNIDFAVVSPGVPLDLDYIVELRENKKVIMSEIELAYRIGLDKNLHFIGITGTNGKTTTTSIVGEIFKSTEWESYVVGNIGNPAVQAADEASENSVLVTELSSFQLESIVEFRPEISAVLNLTEDHMNRHHTMQNYALAKSNIFVNQNKDDKCILNYDDDLTHDMGLNNPADVVYFSRKEKLDSGIYLDDEGNIVFSKDGSIEKIINKKELSLPGSHNLENCMAAIGIAISYGIDKDIIVRVLKTFKAVEHRLEYVDTVNGVKYVNDSKGTNPDSTIKAVQSYEEPIVLIAGGYDKGSDFSELFDVAKKNVSSVIALGETAELIGKTAIKFGIVNIHKAASMKDAVEISKEISKDGDIVLLSPACASWGMYNNYEERGNDFKKCVSEIK
nr:UDP-N-acetylmuramoyl-L-alanine--D-glutamate ligase [Peptostreptococcus faecalis]